MKRIIQTPLIRMSVVFGVLLALSLWQLDFIVSAVSSNVVLNLTIFAVFFFGVILVYRSVITLRNEGLALDALKEAYADVKVEQQGELSDPLWRHYRCKEMATVFKKPDVLGPAYKLISEELARHNDINLSPATMQTLIDSIDVRLQDRKSITQYVAGILVLLGLIGTFLGLMLTLASIGAILDALDFTGDPQEAVEGLMISLQVPLQGMAVGFSSSLFGLVTSLVLSLMVRFSAVAFSEFVQNFEGWLSTIVEIDPGKDSAAESGSVAHSAIIEEKRLSLIMRAARLSVTSNTRVNDKLSKLTDAVQHLSNDARSQNNALDELIGANKQLHEQGRLLGTAMSRTIDTVRVVAANSAIKEEMLESTNSLARQLNERDRHMSDRLQALDGHLTKLNEAKVAPSPASKFETKAKEDAYALLEEIKAGMNKGNMKSLHTNLKDMQSDIAGFAKEKAGKTPMQQQTLNRDKKG